MKKMTMQEIRATSGLSQKKVADAIGTDQANISKLESGLWQPSIDTIARLCRLYAATAHIDGSGSILFVK